MPAIMAVRNATVRRVTAAGGITTWQEIDELDAARCDAVVGMAIYTGQLPPRTLGMSENGTLHTDCVHCLDELRGRAR